MHGVLDVDIPGPAGDIPARVYSPAANGPVPTLVYFHGGRWVVLGIDSHDHVCRSLAVKANCPVVSVDYRKFLVHDDGGLLPTMRCDDESAWPPVSDTVSEAALPSVHADLGGLDHAVLDGLRPSETQRNPGHGAMWSTREALDRCERGREPLFSLSSKFGSGICPPLRCAAVRMKSCKPTVSEKRRF